MGTDGTGNDGVRVEGVVVGGHGVASGRGGDGRFPGGTLGMQMPVFLERGVDLSGFHKGTVNVSVAPWRVRVVSAPVTLRGVVWKEGYPAEDFSFVPCRLRLRDGGEWADGLVYWPHPETKPEHFQDPSVVEVIVPWIEGVEKGVRVELEWAAGAIELAEDGVDAHGGVAGELGDE